MKQHIYHETNKITISTLILIIPMGGNIYEIESF